MCRPDTVSSPPGYDSDQLQPRSYPSLVSFSIWRRGATSFLAWGGLERKLQIR